MAEYDDLVRVLRHLLLEKLEQKRYYIHGLLGNGAGQVQVPGEPDKSYVRPSRSSSVVWEVFNKEVSGPDGWPILVGEIPWQPGFVQVVGTDWSAYPDQDWGDNVGGLRRHAGQHEWFSEFVGTDPLRVGIRAIEPLKTYPVGSGSMSVVVSPYDYTFGNAKTWPGYPSLDLSGAAPSVTGTARFMLTYLDVASNTIGAWSGTVGSLSAAERLDRPTLPTATYLPSAYVRVHADQTTIRELDIWDARQPWSIMPTGSTGGGGAPSGPAGGDLTGTYPDPLVVGIYGYPYGLEVPAEGQVLMFTGSAWRPVTQAAGGGAPSGPAGGDLSGTYPNPSVVGLQGYNVDGAAPSEGDVLMFTGSSWRPTPNLTVGWRVDYDAVIPLSRDAFVVGPVDVLPGASITINGELFIL